LQYDSEQSNADVLSKPTQTRWNDLANPTVATESALGTDMMAHPGLYNLIAPSL
jgi:hypothetical protein